MKAVFSIIIFILFLVIAILIIGFILSSFLGVSFFGGEGKGGAGGGFLISEDKGETWQARNAISEKKDISRVDVIDILLDSQNPETFYIGTKGNGLYKSVDNAKTWVKINDKNQALSPKADVYQAAKDSKDTKNMYLAVFQGGSGKVLKSEDGGESFKQVYIVSAANEQVTGVLVDWYSPQTVFAGTSAGLLLKSYDFGVSWQKIWEFQAPIKKIYISPHDSREIYVATSSKPGKIIRSRDGGKNWNELTEALKEFKGATNVTDLGFDLSHPNVLYIASEFGLLKSTDGGSTFSEVKTIIPSESLPILSVAINPANSDIVYLTAKNQFYKSDDGGVSWQVKILPTSLNAKILKINPQNPDTLYVGLGSSPIGKSKSLF